MLTLRAALLGLALMATNNPYQWSQQAARNVGKMDLELQKIQRAFQLIVDEGPSIVTRLTFTEDLYSVTPFATPAGFSSTTFDAFANAQSGATLMGYGSTYDVSLRNRSGTVALGIIAGTTTVSIPGNLNIAGTVSFTSTTDSTSVSTGAVTTLGGVGIAKSVFFGGAIRSDTAFATPSAFAATAAGYFASAVHGGTVMGFGTTNDAALKNRSGTTVVGVTANTTNATVAGALTVGTNITATNGFILATGVQSQFAVTRRDTLASAWAWYSQTGSFQIFDNVAGVDKVVMLQGGAISFTNAAAAGFNVGPNGATNPAFQVSTNTASLAAGLNVTGAVAAGTVAVSVISSGANANLSIDAKGSGTIVFGGTSTGAFTFTRASTFSAGAVIAAGQALTGTVASSTISGFLSVAATTGTFTNIGGTLTTASQPNVTTMANLTTIGTLVAGAVPASLVTAGTFGAGDYVFPSDLTVTDTLVVGTDPGGAWTLRASSSVTGTNNTTVLFENTGASGDVLIARRSTDTAANGAGWIGQRTRTAGASVVANDVLAGLYGQGYTGSAYSANVGAIRVQAVETFSGGGHGTQIDFATTDVGSTSRTGRWVIRSTGHFAAFTDNAYDIGQSASSSRPRTGYFGTSVVSPVAYLGTNTALSSPALRIVADSGAASNIDNFRFANTPRFNAYRVNGSVASPTTIVSGNELGGLQQGGYDGSTYTNVAVAFVGSATQDWTASAHGSFASILLVADGATALTRAASFWRVGAVKVGTNNTAPAQGGYYGTTDNADDLYTSSVRLRTLYGYTGNFATRVTSPLLGTTTATDVVFDRNSVTKLTLGNTTDTFANNTITNGNADWVFQRNASTIFTLAAASLTMNLPVLTKAYTVATLPAGTKGMVAHVTDALAPAFLTAVVGGGAAFALVAYDGTNWVAV